MEFRTGLRCERCGKPFISPISMHDVAGHALCISCVRHVWREIANPWDVPSSKEHELRIEKVIFNGRATIILWADGEKTVVKCKMGDAYDYYTGFCACVVKRLYGSSKRAKRIMDGKE